MLVKAGAHVDAQDQQKMTPLMRAVDLQEGYPDSIEALIEADVDLEIKEKNGNSACVDDCTKL